MKNSGEIQEEFLVSKLMLKIFLNFKQIKSKLGTTFIESVENFVTKYIKSHETRFGFHLKLNPRHFEEYTNSFHKGNNKGL